MTTSCERTWPRLLIHGASVVLECTPLYNNVAKVVNLLIELHVLTCLLAPKICLLLIRDAAFPLFAPAHTPTLGNAALVNHRRKLVGTFHRLLLLNDVLL